ncbi:MAG: GFA family protein [Ahrensia sp.]|nr:GFA family protein [Ahrensia sp.]
MARDERHGSGAYGSCLCGTVKYRVNGPLRDVVACHCQQCRKQSGHFYAATDCADDDLIIENGGSLAWYSSSDFAKRGFCNGCGSNLFWRRNGSNQTSILAGSLDSDPSIRLTRHIFCADKGTYYEIDDGLPQFEQSD